MAKRFLTLSEAAANARTLIKGATTEDEVIFKQWIWIALRDLGPSTDCIDIATITPANLEIPKPDDFIMAADLALLDASGCEIYYKFRHGKHRIHEDAYGDLSNNVEVSEDQFNYYLSSNGTDVVTAKLRYFKMPLDENGFPQIPAESIQALMMYCRAMWELREGNNRLQFMMLNAEWEKLRARARSRLRKTDMLNTEQIAKEWMSMIGNPKFNNF